MIVTAHKGIKGDNSVEVINGMTVTGKSGVQITPVDGKFPDVNRVIPQDSTDDLPTSGNEIGDGWVIDGFLWVWNGSDRVNVGSFGIDSVDKLPKITKRKAVLDLGGRKIGRSHV